jgi:hypothetical protein
VADDHPSSAPGGPAGRDVQLTTGPPETVLPPLDPAVEAALAEADAATGADRRLRATDIAAAHPEVLAAWAILAESADEPVESYAFARVGYHRGLDSLRANGWRGSGYVRWRQPTNRGFLRSLEALRAAAGRIGEDGEETRCRMFLLQLDPEWDQRSP